MKEAEAIPVSNPVWKKPFQAFIKLQQNCFHDRIREEAEGEHTVGS